MSLVKASGLLCGVLTCAALAGQDVRSDTRGLINDIDRERVCTPAEYGDPTADCVPARNRPTQGLYDLDTSDSPRFGPRSELSANSFAGESYQDA
jgi:hypothetical protein